MASRPAYRRARATLALRRSNGLAEDAAELVALVQQFVDPLSGQQFSAESEPATAFDDREKFQISDFQFSIFNPGKLAARVQLRRLQRLRIGDAQNLRCDRVKKKIPTATTILAQASPQISRLP